MRVVHKTSIHFQEGEESKLVQPPCRFPSSHGKFKLHLLLEKTLLRSLTSPEHRSRSSGRIPVCPEGASRFVAVEVDSKEGQGRRTSTLTFNRANVGHTGLKMVYI